MRLTPNHIDYLAYLIYKTMKDNPHVTVHNPDAIVSAARAHITENLRLEDQLEKEALELLSRHRQQILSSDADYQRMVRETVRMLARKRGVVV